MRSTFHRQRGSAHSAPHPPPARIQPPPSCHQMPARGPPRFIHNPEPRPPQPVHSAPQPPASTETERGRWDPPALSAAAGPPSPETAMHHGSGVGAACRREGTATTASLPPSAGPHAHTPPRPTAAAAAQGREALAAAGATGSRHTHRRPPCSRPPAAGHCGDTEGGVAQPRRPTLPRP